MIRSILFVGSLVCALCFAHEANATTLNVNLDLVFSDPGDVNSGGNWTVSALAGDFGLAGIVFDILPANFAGNFLISNTIFEVQEFDTLGGGGMGFEIVTGDNLATPTLNVGVGSAVDLVTGTFNAGDVPALANIGANLFDTNGVLVGVSGQNLTSSATNNIIPEPTTLILFGIGLIGVVSTSRRRS